jgi:hypothetical protein
MPTDRYLIGLAMKFIACVEMADQAYDFLAEYVEDEKISNDRLLNIMEEWGGISRAFAERSLRMFRGG